MAERPSQDEIRKRVLEDRPSFAIPVEIPDPPAVPRDSATVIVVRDGAEGLEVFMLERHLNSDFAGGAYVFPGGTIDDRDTDPAAAAFFDGPAAADAAALVDARPDRALAFHLCAIRETFEEAGILLARREGTPVRLTDDAERHEKWRQSCYPSSFDQPFYISPYVRGTSTLSAWCPLACESAKCASED